MDDVALSRETVAVPPTDPGGQAAPAPCPSAAGSGGAGDGPGKEVLVFEWWDACQLAFVFVLTQYIAFTVADRVGAALIGSWPQAVSLLADQLAVAAFPVAWLFRVQPRARQLFNDPRPGRGEFLALIALSVPFGCLLEYVARRPYLTCGLPLFAITSPPMSPGTLSLILTVVIGPAVEEIFFRGVLGRDLIRRYGPVLGTVITAAIFAATRAGRSQVGAAFILGVACHLAYFGTGSIAAAILLHALTNCFCPNFNLADNDPALVLSALLTISALGYALCAGRLRSPDGRSPADPQSPGPAPPPGGAFEGPDGRRFAFRCLVLLSPLPFYCQMFYRLQSRMFSWNGPFNL